jgi:hypothetical protein
MKKVFAIGLLIIGGIILIVSFFLIYVAIETYIDYSGNLMTEAKSIYDSCLKGGEITLLIGLIFILIGWISIKRIKK